MNVDNIIGLKYDDVKQDLINNGYKIEIKLISSDKIKNKDTLVIVSAKFIDKLAILYLGEFLYNI